MSMRGIGLALWVLVSIGAAPGSALAECSEDSFALIDDVLDDCGDLLTDLDEQPWYETLTSGNVELPMDERIAALRGLAKAVEADGALDPRWVRGFVARLDDAGIEQGQADALGAADAREGCDCVFFMGRERDATCHALGPPAEAQSTCGAGLRIEADPALSARYYAYLDAAQRGLRMLGAEARREMHVELRRTLARYRNLTVNGYTQFPWELAVNGVLRKRPAIDAPFTSEAAQPRRWQMIVAHPVVGIGLRGMRRGQQPQARGVAVLGLEAMGALYYTRSFAHYFGLSLLASVDNLDFADPRLGVDVHLTRFVHVGYALALTRAHEKDATLFFSLDLFGWGARAAGITGVDLSAPEA